MAQQEGPFSEYLQMAKMTPQVQVPQPTGLEGAGSVIGNIFMNFIRGAQQGKMQKFAMQKMEEQKRFDAYQDAIKRVAASGLPASDKQALYAQLESPLIQRVASDKDIAKDKSGNPIARLLHGIAVNMTGGQIPKEGEKLPMDPVAEALRAVSDPERQADRIAAKYDADMNQAISKALAKAEQGGKEVDVSTFMGDRDILSIWEQGKARLGRDFTPSSLSVALQRFPRLTAEQRAKGAEYRALFPQYFGPGAAQQEPQERTTAPPPALPQFPSIETPESLAVKPPAAIPVSTAPPPSVVQPPVATSQAVRVPTPEPPPLEKEKSALPPGAVLITPEIERTAQRRASLLNDSSFFSVGTTTGRFETPSGDEISGVSMRIVMPDGTVKKGIKDESTGILYQNARPLRPGDYSKNEVSRLKGNALKVVQDTLKDDPQALSLFANQVETDALASNGESLRKIPEKISDYVTKRIADRKKEEARQKGQISRNSVLQRQIDVQDRSEVRRAADAWASSQNKKDFDMLDTQFQAFSSETQGVNVPEYLADPVKYQRDRKLTREQMVAVETMIDKSLARLISKSTDTRTGVKQQEEKSYTELSGLPTELKNKILYLAGGGSGLLGDYNTRKMLWNQISALRTAVRNKVVSDRDRRVNELKSFDINPKIIEPAFQLQELAPVGAGGGRRLLETAPSRREAGGKGGAGAQVTKNPADL